jgi:sialic acid synthase SpsE
MLVPVDTTIAGRSISNGAPMFVIAELGLNHNGDTDLAMRLVEAAAEAGASAIKLQAFRADRLIAVDAPGPAHVEGGSLRELFRTFELSTTDYRRIVAHARRVGIGVLVTAFDVETVQAFDAMGVDAFKIASGDLTHMALIEAAARTRRPVVISTGMSEQADVDDALDWAVGAGARALAVLHCVSAYPTPDDQQNLRAIATLAHRCRVPVGLSDHGMGRDAAVMAFTLGATLYERHLHLPGTGAIDAAVSSTPEQLRDIVQAVERCRTALGHGRREPMPAEVANVHPSRRGLYAARALRAGDVVTEADVVALRPAAGLGARFHRSLVGCRVRRPIAAGESFAFEDLSTDVLAVGEEVARGA